PHRRSILECAPMLLPLSRLLEEAPPLLLRGGGRGGRGGRADSGASHLRLLPQTSPPPLLSFSHPFFAIPLADGTVCVSDYGNDRLRIVSPRGGPASLPSHHPFCAAQLKRPLGLALSSEGLFVVDARRVQLIDREGRVVKELGGGVGAPPDAPLQKSERSHTISLRQPYGVALGPTGQIYVSDAGRHEVAVFEQSGDFSFKFGSHGSAIGQLDDPRGIAVREMQVVSPHAQQVGVALSADLLFVSEYIGSRIHVLSVAGECLQIVRAPFGGAFACALSSDEQQVA
ncbi:MAG: hypothetical protein SGPRY_010263, partial [Prymnesium sp.]